MHALAHIASLNILLIVSCLQAIVFRQALYGEADILQSKIVKEA